MTYRLTRTLQHEPHDDCAHVHCYFHGVDEYPRHRGYMACFECGHLYNTGGALRRAYRATGWHLLWGDLRSAPWRSQPGFPTKLSGLRAWARGWFVKPDKISFCQFCSHDF